MMEQAVPGPPRFRSQAFSTSQRFPSEPRASRPCFVPQPFLGFSFRAFPSQRSDTPLEAAAPLQFVTRVPQRTLRDSSPPVSPTPTPFGALAWFPAAAMAPFRQNQKILLPGHREPRLARPLHSASFVCFEAFSLCESVRADSSCPDPTVAALVAFCPSEVLAPHASGPV